MSKDANSCDCPSCDCDPCDCDQQDNLVDDMSKMEVDEIDEVTSTPEQKHDINMEILELIKYRQKRKWYSTVGIVVIFLFMLTCMFGFIMGGMELPSEWKEILLVMLGAFVGSFTKVIDFWFNNSENDNKLLESAND